MSSMSLPSSLFLVSSFTFSLLARFSPAVLSLRNLSAVQDCDEGEDEQPLTTGGALQKS